MLKTSKALSSGTAKAFRIEDKKIDDENLYDIIWQANGDEEGIAMLIEKDDLIHLGELIKNKLK